MMQWQVWEHPTTGQLWAYLFNYGVYMMAVPVSPEWLRVQIWEDENGSEE